jgi:hypothetical protein
MNAKFTDLEEHYPLAMSRVRGKRMYSRPIKIKIEEFTRLVEAIYSGRFMDSSREVRRTSEFVKDGNF